MKTNRARSKIKIIDHQISKLQQATKSDWGLLTYWHLELCQRFPLYYEWHKNPTSNSVHWMIFILLIYYLLWYDFQIQIYSLFN